MGKMCKQVTADWKQEGPRPASCDQFPQGGLVESPGPGRQPRRLQQWTSIRVSGVTTVGDNSPPPIPSLASPSFSVDPWRHHSSPSQWEASLGSKQDSGCCFVSGRL